MFDREKKGHIHTNMVSTILRTLGQTFEEKDLQTLITEIDADGNFFFCLYIFCSFLINQSIDRLFIYLWLIKFPYLFFSVGSGELEFDEFLTLTARFLVEEDAEAMQEELREAFRMYDKEGNGYIPTSALREILRALDDKLTNDELDEMIAEIDTDGSGTVDFDGKFSFSIRKQHCITDVLPYLFFFYWIIYFHWKTK